MRLTDHTQTLRRTAVATIAAAGLVLGAAACGDDEDGTVEVEETVPVTETEVVEEDVTETLEPTATETDVVEEEVEVTETETNTETEFEETE